jgi:hypothetical protein
MQIERDAYRSMLKDVGGDDAEKWANQYKKVQLKKNKIIIAKTTPSTIDKFAAQF